MIKIENINEEDGEDSDISEKLLIKKDVAKIVNKVKMPVKELKGHKKAIRDLAYCER